MKTATVVAALGLIATTSAYPFMANYHEMTEKQKKDLTSLANGGLQKRTAVAYSSQYPYTGAKIDGLPGTQVGGVQVPAPGDTDHAFQAPGSGDIRGPCPGLNAAANHGFLSRDGITTFDELVAAQQNVYNVGYDLAVVLATLGVGLDGDLVTLKLSIGGDATSQTASPLSVGAVEGGLDTHNKFEADSSLTRNDYFTNNGDDYTFNGTLFGYMAEACGNSFDRECMSSYRLSRYQQSQAENGQFLFLPTALLLYGASSFLYELMPTNGGQPDLATISSFFGAVKNSDGTWSHVPERIPDNWFNRATAYTGTDVTAEILAQYIANPVPFGFNVGQGNFLGLNYGSEIVNGKFSPSSAEDISCILYQALLAAVPSTIQGLVTNTLASLTYIAKGISPFFTGLGCPAVDPSSGTNTLRRAMQGQL